MAREAGSGHPVTKTFYRLKPTAQGKLNLTFEPVTNYATASAIELIDESDGVWHGNCPGSEDCRVNVQAGNAVQPEPSGSHNAH